MINTLSTDLFSSHEVATASGLAGTAAWTGGLSFSLVVGALGVVVGEEQAASTAAGGAAAKEVS